MGELIRLANTSSPHIRFALRRRDDGFIEFVEQILDTDSGAWRENDRSGLCDDVTSAERDLEAYLRDYEVS